MTIEKSSLLLFICVCAVSIIAAHIDPVMLDPIMGEYDVRYPSQASNVTMSFGDMVLTEGQREALKKGENAFGAVVIGDYLRWDNAVIPYEIDCSIENLPQSLEAVYAAMAQWERKTCIRFVKHTTEKFKLTFFRSTHCWGNVGQVYRAHISVGPSCDFEHVMAHEIGHAVGMFHEQNRKDRDDWVRIHWENIGGFDDAFAIIPNTESLGVEYDYASIMHYPWTAFSTNGRPTMEPIRDTKGKEPYIEISKSDILQTSRMYNCPAIEKKRGEVMKRFRRRKRFSEEECVDSSQDCPKWAKAGLCSTKESVRMTCKLTCGNPACFGSKCQDLHGACESWGKYGYCSKNKNVAKHCQKTCNPMCKDKPAATQSPVTSAPETKAPTTHAPETKAPATKPPATPAPETKPPATKPPATKQRMTQAPETKAPETKAPATHAPITEQPTTSPTQEDTWPNRHFLGIGRLCVDLHWNCAEWAREGGCDENPGWMLINCMKSCPKARCDRKGLKPFGKCNEPLGLAFDGSGQYKIPDNAFTADTFLARAWYAPPSNARLYLEDNYNNYQIGAWCAAAREKPGYLQVDLQKVTTVKYIATQGRSKMYERTSVFKIQYSKRGNKFATYKENGADKLFFGNCDYITPVLNTFKKPIRARYIRYVPFRYNWPCVRMELYGCD